MTKKDKRAYQNWLTIKMYRDMGYDQWMISNLTGLDIEEVIKIENYFGD